MPTVDDEIADAEALLERIADAVEDIRAAGHQIDPAAGQLLDELLIDRGQPIDVDGNTARVVSLDSAIMCLYMISARFVSRSSPPTMKSELA